MKEFNNEIIQNRQRALLSFIQQLVEEKELKANLPKYICTVKKIYEDGWRHNYSIITQYFLLHYSPENFDANLLGVVSKLLELRDYLQDNRDDLFNEIYAISDDNPYYGMDLDRSKRFQNCRRSLEKLADHLNLELIRKRFIENLYKKVEDYSKEATKNVEKLKEEVSVVSSNLKSESKRQKQESITILGIFSSIIGVLVAGIGLSSAIFSNMDGVSSWLLCGLTGLIILFISNTLFQLFNFLREISDRQTKTSYILWCFNVIISLISICCLWMNYN